MKYFLYVNRFIKYMKNIFHMKYEYIAIWYYIAILSFEWSNGDIRHSLQICTWKQFQSSIRHVKWFKHLYPGCEVKFPPCLSHISRNGSGHKVSRIVEETLWGIHFIIYLKTVAHIVIFAKFSRGLRPRSP